MTGSSVDIRGRNSRPRMRYGAIFCAFWVLSFLSANCEAAFGQTYRIEHETFQDIDVLSTPDAVCTMKREGDRTGKFRLPHSDAVKQRMYVVRVNVTRNHENLVISCERAGYLARYVVLKFGRVSYIHDFPVCPTATGSNAGNDCRSRPSASTNEAWQYPNTAVIILERN
jgi:hypothetical protein